MTGWHVALVLLAMGLLLLLCLGVLAALVLGAVASVSQGHGNRARDRVTYETTANAILDAATAAVERLGAREVTVEDRGVVRAVRGPSAWSPGEALTVRATTNPAPPARQQVTIESRSTVPGTRIDWGRNRRNVAALRRELDQRLAAR